MLLYLWHVITIVLNSNRKPYMGSSMAPLDLTLSEGQSQNDQDFKASYLLKEPS